MLHQSGGDQRNQSPFNIVVLEHGLLAHLVNRENHTSKPLARVPTRS
jgi:hypothetical protein